MQKIAAQLRPAFRAAIVPIFRDEGRKVRIQTFDSVQSHFHEISDQQVVEDFMANTGYERVARRLNTDAPVPEGWIEIDGMGFSTEIDFNKSKVTLQMLSSPEIGIDELL